MACASSRSPGHGRCPPWLKFPIPNSDTAAARGLFCPAPDSLLLDRVGGLGHFFTGLSLHFVSQLQLVALGQLLQAVVLCQRALQIEQILSALVAAQESRKLHRAVLAAFVPQHGPVNPHVYLVRGLLHPLHETRSLHHQVLQPTMQRTNARDRFMGPGEPPQQPATVQTQLRRRIRGQFRRLSIAVAGVPYYWQRGSHWQGPGVSSASTCCAFCRSYAMA